MARRKRIKFRTHKTSKHGSKTQIIKRIRFLQKRTIPTAKFYNQFTVEDLKRIRDSAKLDYDLWQWELNRIKKKARANKK